MALEGSENGTGKGGLVFLLAWLDRMSSLCWCIWWRWRVLDGKRLVVFYPLGFIVSMHTVALEVP